MDPVKFLSGHEPFAQLSPRGLSRLGRGLEISYARRGDLILRRNGPPNDFLWVVRKGTVELERDGVSTDVLGQGELFGFPSLLAASSPRFDVVATSECLIYRLPRMTFEELLEEEGFREFFLEGLASRLRGATEREPLPLAGDLTTRVERLVRRAPVFVPREATVEQAAGRMRDERVSSVLIAGEPAGILTDRDLRTRVLAEGRGPQTPVAEVMSQPLRTFPADAPVFDALLHLLSERVHHLPLVKDGKITGLVTHTDLLRHQIKSPGYLLKTIEKAPDAQALAGYADEISSMVEALSWSGLGATRIGQLVASLNDALVQSLLRRAEEKLGVPPCPYSWLVLGSEGRREQALITDQDNALVYARAGEEEASYFAQLAETVVQGLIDASFPPCAGGFMATNWCRPLDEWVELFRGWTHEPDPQALLEVANFFDFRAVHGGLDLEPLHRCIEQGARSDLFLGHLARASLGMRPPIGLFRRIRSEEEGIDLKAGGLMPIIGIARIHGLEARSRERATLDRLAAARDAGTLSRDGAETLTEGFRFIFRIRLKAQLAAARAGEQPTNRIRIESLGTLQARHLKETFLHIRDMQQGMAQRFHVDMLG